MSIFCVLSIQTSERATPVKVTRSDTSTSSTGDPCPSLTV